MTVRIHDVTAALRTDLPVWPGERGLERTLVKNLAAGDSSTVSHLSLGVHTGTHVDAPVHFLAGGAGVEALPLDALMGPATVVEVPRRAGGITADELEAAGVPPDAERLLVKTPNSGWSRSEAGFRHVFAALSAEAADWCVARGTRLVGIDYLSIEPPGPEPRGYPVHRHLLEAGVVILEGLDLEGVAPGSYFLAALPLLVPGSDGAPARAVLVEGLPRP